MGIEGILNQSFPNGLAMSGGDGLTGGAPPSDVEALVLSARTSDPVFRGGAMRALDQITGNAALSDELVNGGGASTPDLAAAPQTATGSASATPVTVTAGEKQRRLQAALPAAIANVKAAVADPALTPAEAADLKAAAGALSRPGTYYAYGVIPDQPNVLAAAGTHDGQATIVINPNAPGLFKSDGTVDTVMLSAILVHEGRHAHDARFYGERDGPTTLLDDRRTERNAYRTEAIYLKATDATVRIPDPQRVSVPLTAATVNEAAENSVHSWVKAAATNAKQANTLIDQKYAVYVRQVAISDKASGTHTIPHPRQAHIPVPVYSPPASN